ncbi:hypothetical protein J3A64_000145 [Pseudarthrobacter sp. PvP004]|uniref:FG-GAP repeat domain-containing protein n=1 Tax=Pseudarthrobacter sp. PvP004 TaxID=2817850 RepID=UPI001AE6DE74|nr:VCBS repeat-containing protein [Pseudarthrobacter sp. PvP004]MBP2264681.1 hypothetical protein [Pseudarthrobacter sp. PvP004]
MGTFRALAVKSAVLAAVLLSSTVAGLPPAVAKDGIESAPQASSYIPPIVGLPFVGSELTLGITQFQKCKTEEAPNGFVLEWLSNGVPLPAERQGEFLKLIPEDRGKRISMNVHTQCAVPQVFYSRVTRPIEASSRAMGWTGRGNFELLGRTDGGDLVLYPRTYEPHWVYWGPGMELLQFPSSWDEPRVVGTGWNIFDIVFSPGDFDGDGHNDILGRDSAGNLHLYPGDGEGGWLPPKQVGSGWGIFDSIVGPGDFDGDGLNDVLARDRSGNLHLYPGSGDGGWLAPSQVGAGWQVFDKIIAAGDSTGDGTADIFARDRSGFLYQYPSDGYGGWAGPSLVGHGWDEMAEISSAGPSEKSYNISSSELIAYTHDGDLFRYDNIGIDGRYSLFKQGQIGNGWDIFSSLI